MKRVFVDTGGFFALYSSNDFDHVSAVALVRRANAERWLLATSNAVVIETYALLIADTFSLAKSQRNGSLCSDGTPPAA